MRTELAQIREELGDCTRCKLSKDRNKIVFGAGNPDADWVIIGEAPGVVEDVLGSPFKGKSGSLLNKILEELDLYRQDVYITNIVKCHPPRNRDPEKDEVEQCSPFLRAQLEAINPKVITTLGKTASSTLLNSKVPMAQLRGKLFTYNNITVVPAYHPAFVLRSQPDKLQLFRDDLFSAFDVMMNKKRFG